MFRSLFGKNWRKSPAHLLLLSKFTRPHTVEEYTRTDGWANVLEEPPAKAIDRFVKEGLLAEAPLTAVLDARLKLDNLKELCRRHKLPVSGRKHELIERLLATDPKGMAKAASGPRVYLATETGMALANQVAAQLKAEREELEREVAHLVEQRKFAHAARTVAAYEARQVFPRGIGIDWATHDTSTDAAAVERIFQAKPKILHKLNGHQLHTLRTAAANMYLLGVSSAKRWLPADFHTDLAMDADAAVRMLWFYVSHQQTLAGYKRIGVRHVRIIVANDEHTCPSCAKLAAKSYRLDQAPELPNPDCTCRMGCRCTFAYDDR